MDAEPHAEQLAAVLQLALVSGIGPRLYRALVERFGSAAAVLAASTGELKEVEGIGPKLARNVLAARDEVDVAAELALCREHGIDLVTQDDATYPQALREIPDPPIVLFRRGEIRPEDTVAVAMVGSRHATRYGLDQAEKLARGLAQAGLTIVSGLARGIDAAAHRGALAGGGRTIAVLGSGHLALYPPEHADLAEQVAAHGAVLSECPPRMEAQGGIFPQRNRIITGMSLGVLVVEASETSGALISARHAMEQGREVFAVPGRVDNRMARGCHRLLRDGAKLVETIDDVLEELGPLCAPAPRADGATVHHPAELQLNELELQVLHAIDPDPTPIDDVAARTQLPVHSVLSTLSVLEMRRVVRRISGTLVARI